MRIAGMNIWNSLAYATDLKAGSKLKGPFTIAMSLFEKRVNFIVSNEGSDFMVHFVN